MATQTRLLGAGVSEETEGQDTGAEAVAGGVDPAAIALALNGASREDAGAFLTDQRALIADQRRHLHEQFRQLSLKLWEMRLGVLLRVATAFIGVAVSAALAFLIWDAAHSNDLVIDVFQVPPDLASRGLSGSAVAAKLSDKIAAMQAKTRSNRPARSYANGLSEGLKLEIPETGVSLSELDRFLRAKLGKDLHIGGELVQTAKGIALTARAGADSATVTGAEVDMDGLLQKPSEEIYRTTQPYRYAVWLQIQGRGEESVAILRSLAVNGPLAERGWAYVGLGGNARERQSERAGLALYQRGLALDPNNFLLAADIASAETALGREEEASRYGQMALALLTAHGANYTVPGRIAIPEHNYRAEILRHQGALLQSLQERSAAAELVAAAGLAYQGFTFRAETLALLHQTTAAHANLAEAPPLSINALPTSVPSMTIAMAEQDWPGVLAAEKDFAALVKLLPGFAGAKATMVDPAIAVALAHMGNFAAAKARLKDLPGDCYPCLRARAQVAALQGQDARADWWFARAAAAAPTTPYAETEWGRALLDRKQAGAAIAHFSAANRIGPHFADPLEGWGEALMAKNQSHLAVAKFAEADKYATNWGRLHLKWGEALVYAGKKDEAKAQFARAAVLDLTPSEKAERAGMVHG